MKNICGFSAACGLFLSRCFFPICEESACLWLAAANCIYHTISFPKTQAIFILFPKNFLFAWNLSITAFWAGKSNTKLARHPTIENRFFCYFSWIRRNTKLSTCLTDQNIEEGFPLKILPSFRPTWRADRDKKTPQTNIIWKFQHR